MASEIGKKVAGFLLSETVYRKDGESEPFELGVSQGKLILLTLGITRIIEQESLDVSIWGSADGESWRDEPLAAFPQKFYCGTYTILLDLSAQPDVAYIKAKWKMSRWGRGDPSPLFGFYLFLEPAAADAHRTASV